MLVLVQISVQINFIVNPHIKRQILDQHSRSVLYWPDKNKVFNDHSKSFSYMLHTHCRTCFIYVTYPLPHLIQTANLVSMAVQSLSHRRQPNNNIDQVKQGSLIRIDLMINAALAVLFKVWNRVYKLKLIYFSFDTKNIFPKCCIQIYCTKIHQRLW